MTPHLSLPLALIPVIAFAVWRRVRMQFGPQPIRRKRMVARIAILMVLAGLIGVAAIHNTQPVAGLVGGLVAGAGLGLIGLRLSRFEVHPVKGDCYVPNPYMGALVTALLLARLAWRFAMLSPQMQNPAGAAAPIHGPALGHSPLTMLTFGLVVGYYVCYYTGLLIHHQRFMHNRPELRESA